MRQEITNSDILQAIMELGERQKEMSAEFEGLSQKQHDMSGELKGLSQKITDTDKRLNAKIDILSNRLLETQEEVNILKSAK